MKTKLTPKLLSVISRQIQTGNALWAMLLLNEYRESEPELADALAERARQFSRSGLYHCGAAVASQVLDGATLESLSDEDRQSVRQGGSLHFAPSDVHRKTTLNAALHRPMPGVRAMRLQQSCRKRTAG